VRLSHINSIRMENRETQLNRKLSGEGEKERDPSRGEVSVSVCVSCVCVCVCRVCELIS